MTDIKELFDMVTKQTEPDLDSWKEQEDRQRKLARNRKTAAFGVAAVIVVLAAISFASLRGSGGEGSSPADGGSNPSPTTITNSYLDLVTGERTPVEANLTGAGRPEVSPNGESVVWFTFEDGIHVSALDGSGEVAVSPEGLDGYAATWIDDETILFQGRSLRGDENQIGDLYAANVSTGEATMITDLPDVNHGEWFLISDVSPDGTTVLYHLPRKGNEGYDLWTAPIAGGEATLLREDAGFAQYGPDGSIAFLDDAVSFEGDAIWIMDGDGSDARSLVEDRGASLGWPRFSPDGTKVAYTHDGRIELVDSATGQVTETDEVAVEYTWYDDDTLIVD